jgi:hypothetical protein
LTRTGFRPFTFKVVVHYLGEFVTNIDSQLSEAIDTDLLLVLFMAVYGKQQISDESTQNLGHETMGPILPESLKLRRSWQVEA